VLAARALADEALRAPIVAGEVPCAWIEAADGDASRRRQGRRLADRSVADAPAPVLSWLPRRSLGLREARRRQLAQRGRHARARPDAPPRTAVVRRRRPASRSPPVSTAERLRRVASILACAEAVGGIERTVEMSVEYCKVRTQFDKPIGSFQAVKHRCADMAVRAEVARSATIYAPSACATAPPTPNTRSAAKILCADAYLQNAADNIQNHGGMGFTWECDAHLYLKRAHGFELGFGTRRRQLDRLVAAMRGA
jgi:hypothetical protein